MRREAEARAERRFNDVRKLANSFLFEFHDAIRDLPGSTPARALVVQRALEYLDELSKEASDDSALRRELADAYQKVGDVQGNPYSANLGDMKGALDSYGKAIRLLEPAVAAEGATLDERSSLATAYLVSGGITLTAGDATKAVDLARKGLGLRQELAALDPGDARRQIDLAQGWQFLAFNLSADGKDSEAAAALAEQRSILLVRQRASPDDRGVRRSLAQNLYLSGESLERAGDLAGALEAHREAAAEQERLLAEEPTSVALRRALAYSYTEIGNTRMTIGSPSEALADYRHALALFESMAAADPKSTDPRLGVAMGHHNVGDALAALGRRAESLDEFRKARPHYEAVLAASPSNAWAGGMFAALCLRMAEGTAPTDRPAACALYGRSLELFERFSVSRGLARGDREDYERAKAGVAGCAAAPS